MPRSPAGRMTETDFNSLLGEALRRRMPRYRVHPERTRILANPSVRPDITIEPRNGIPVIVESEFLPARTVERDAVARLGAGFARSENIVEQVIAVRIPEAVRRRPPDAAGMREIRFEYCVHSGTADRPMRWPETGWIPGGIDDLAHCIEMVSLSENRIIEGANILEMGIERLAGSLRNDALDNHPDTLAVMAGLLCQEDGEQTTRMAVAIMANAICFHAALAGNHGIPNLSNLHGRGGYPLKADLLNCWSDILRINYWPIFAIASDLLRTVPDGSSPVLLRGLERISEELASIGGTTMHDLSGRMFQRLITDRKFLATFFTLPTSSTLLAELAVPRLAADWSSDDAVRALRVADFACGTGALLGAAYQSMRSRIRRAGRNDEELHGGMMESVLIAADIMPAATHLTASTLSGAHPAQTFTQTRIFTMPYGSRNEADGENGGDGIVKIGSLDMLRDETAWTLFPTGGDVLHGEGEGEDADHTLRVEVAHASMDLVIMNPPFTRPTNHETAEVPVPSFAGFNTPAKEQQLMSRRLAQIRSALQLHAGHGNAGLASNFVDLAHNKVRRGGIIALVLPASCLRGEAWSGMRNLLETEYKDILIVGIAAHGPTRMAFSADTGMAEVLIIATRLPDGEQPDGTACFANLHRRPTNLLEAAEIARTIRGIAEPGGHEYLEAGSEVIGNILRASIRETGCSRVREPRLAAAAMGLEQGQLRLPRMEGTNPIPVARLCEIGDRGLLHRDMNGTGMGRDGLPRGPFDIIPLHGRTSAAAYPALWGHEAARETCLMVSPDTEGRVRNRCEDKAAAVWRRTASRLHLNLDFRINSQPLAACLTPEPTIGGRAWPNYLVRDSSWEKLLILWANCTLGLILFWWIGNRQQQGRATLSISGLPALTVLDPRALSAARIDRAEEIFADHSSRTLLPANEAYRDPVRKSLDRAILADLLGLPEMMLDSLSFLREQWCAEPTVHGGKATRPQQ